MALAHMGASLIVFGTAKVPTAAHSLPERGVLWRFPIIINILSVTFRLSWFFLCTLFCNFQFLKMLSKVLLETFTSF